MNDTLLPGYGLVRQKGMVVHVGTYLGLSRVVHINPDGIQIESLNTFMTGCQVGVVKNEVSSHSLSVRLDKVLHEKLTYDPLVWNCEHLANYLQKGERQSPQLLGAALGLTVGVGVANARKMGVGGALFTVIGCAWLGSQMMAPAIM